MVSVGVAATFACDPAYESPCRVERQTTVLADSLITTRGSVAIARTVSGFTASWLKIETPDAGGDQTPFIGGFEIADLDPNGALVRRETAVAPAPLRERKGSLEAAGISREEGATLVYWTESITTTDPDGRLRTDFTLKTAYGDRVVTPAGGACEKCTMRVALVGFADESIAIVRTSPDVIVPIPGDPIPAPVYVGLHLRRDGTLTTEPLPSLTIAPGIALVGAQATSPGALSAVLDVEGRIVVSSGPKSWLLDRSLRVLAGPTDLPGADARALWGAPSDVSLAWTVSPNDDGRSNSAFARREVFLANGAITERLTHGRAVLGAERRGDDVGLAFESAGRLFFAASSSTGQKRGGDVFIRMIAENGSQFGEYSPEAATAVGAASPGHFTLVTLGGGFLETAEIVCAP